MKLLKIFGFLVAIISLYTTYNIINTKPVQADDLSDQLNQKSAEIQQLQQQLDEARGQEKTLKSQLDYIDAQTKLTELKIQQTNFQIAKLDQEISDLDGRITRLSASVDSISQVLLNRIVQTYKYDNYNGLDLLFSSNGFSDLLEKVKYIEVAQANDKKVLYQLQATKTTYNDQKTDKQTRQAEEEKLKKDLDTYSTQLDQQKADKAALLRITQNNEANYQARLQAALAEQSAILGILSGAGHETPDGPVHQGDVIATIIPSASACSSGAHLHFEVHQNDTIQDPSNFLSNISFSYVDAATESSPGADEGAINPHGSWPWPLSGSIMITQGYGMTPYARTTGAYGPTGHTGIDMWAGFGGLAVHAVHDGQLSHGGIACGGGTLLYKRVDHGDGTSSYYLHVT